MKYTFYTLSDPDTLEVRYVGVTTNTISNRFSQHKNSAVKGKDKSNKTLWFQSVLEAGKLPIVTVLFVHICEDDSWVILEENLISKYPNLTNMHLGGKGIIKGERHSTTAFNNKPVVKIHPWKNEILETYVSAVQANKDYAKNGISTGVISQTVQGKHSHSFGYRWSYAEPLIFSPPLKYYFLCVNGVIVKEYPSKAEFREDLTWIMNTYDVWGVTTNIPSISQ